MVWRGGGPHPGSPAPQRSGGGAPAPPGNQVLTPRRLQVLKQEKYIIPQKYLDLLASIQWPDLMTWHDEWRPYLPLDKPFALTYPYFTSPDFTFSWPFLTNFPDSYLLTWTFLTHSYWLDLSWLGLSWLYLSWLNLSWTWIFLTWPLLT